MIYLLEDESGIRNFVIYALNNSGFEAEGFETPSAFDKAMAKQLPDLVLLDIMLPEEDGLSILRRLRSSSATRKLPVIMLSAKGTEFDKVTGLDSGADDYISKPFGTMELISRVRALLRRSGADETAAEVISLGGISILPQQHDKEYDLLLLLVKNKGRVFSRDELLQKVWGYDFSGESRTVDVHIRTLRAKLGDSGDLIMTVRGVGYKAGEPV